MGSSDQRTIRSIVFRLTDYRKPPREDGYPDKRKRGRNHKSWGLELGSEGRGISRGNSTSERSVLAWVRAGMVWCS